RQSAVGRHRASPPCAGVGSGRRGAVAGAGGGVGPVGAVERLAPRRSGAGSAPGRPLARARWYPRGGSPDRYRRLIGHLPCRVCRVAPVARPPASGKHLQDGDGLGRGAFWASDEERVLPNRERLLPHVPAVPLLAPILCLLCLAASHVEAADSDAFGAATSQPL